jgi:branched-chain amino acid transport system ATP-binding protein
MSNESVHTDVVVPVGSAGFGDQSRTLKLDGLCVARGTRPVVHDVTMEVPAGQVTGMLGPNGAGKSSIALAIAGMLRVVGGSITIDGEAVHNRRAEQVRALGVSVVPEGRRLLPDLSVEDNLKVATYSLGKSAAQEGLDYTLSLFPELEKRWKIGGRLLSGGEQQMVVLAQALVSRPKILVVDELSLGLAPIVVKRLVPVLDDVAKSGVGVLLIEQFAHVVLGLSTTAHVLEGGRIRYSGAAAELIDKPELLHSAYLLRG